MEARDRAGQRRRGSREREREKWQDMIRLKPESQKRWDTIKVILRTITVVCGLGLVALGLGLYLYTYPDIYYSPFQDVFIIGVLTPGACACLWAIAEFITIIVRRKRSGHRLTGIPPGAHVAVDLLLWLDNLIFFCLLTSQLPSMLQGYPYFSIDDKQIAIRIAGLALLLALTGLHFTLFVRACMETERRNSERQIRRAITALRQQGVNLGDTINHRDAGRDREEDNEDSHELSTLAPGSLRNVRSAQKKPETPHDSAHSDGGLGADAVDSEAAMQQEDNVKFVMPASIIQEMTGQKFTGMAPADGEDKYPGLRRK